MIKKPSLALKITNLTKIYKDSKKEFLALDNINLELEEGRILGLLGPNGAGKSTLINILAGVTIKTSGEVQLMGLDMDKNRIKSKYLIGIASQEIMLDVFFTVKETISIYAGYYGIKLSDSEINTLLDTLGLLDKANAKPRALSGGMKRRLVIAKAMVHNPKILVLDEPTAGVDVALREKLWEYVKMLRKRGTTIIITTHYLEEAEELCDDIAFINNGKITLSDKKTKLLNTLGMKQIMVEFVEPINQSLMENFPKECNVTSLSEHSIQILFSPQKITVDSILKLITEFDSKVQDINIIPPKLEDIFNMIINDDMEAYSISK